MFLDRSLAEQALYANQTFEDAVEWCLSSTTAANLPGAQPAAAGRAGGSGSGAGSGSGGGGGSAASPAAAGPPQRPLPAQPQATQRKSRVSTDSRLQKEWEEQRLSNKMPTAVVFAEPLGEEELGGLREWVGVILGPDDSVYAGHAFQVLLILICC